MTTKDFKIISEILIMHQTHADPHDMNSLIRETCAVLKRTNPKFNETIFRDCVKKAQ